MNRLNFLAFGTAALLASGEIPSAYAQSGVTLYGIVDAGPTYVSNTGGSSLVKLDDGISIGNRVGFKGVEDLGGGVKTVFKLENGFRLGTGAPTAGGGFGLQSYVGLQNAIGTLSLGNQLDMTREMVNFSSVSAWGSGYAIHQGDFDRFNGDRLPNSVKFQSSSFDGVTFGGVYSFGNVAGDFKQNSAYSFGAKYSGDRLMVGTAYTRLNNPHGIYAFDPYAMIGVKSFLGQPTVAQDPSSGKPIDLFANTPMDIDSSGTFGIGASYVIDKVTLMGNFTHTTVKGYGQTTHMRVFEGGGILQLTPALSIITGYQYTQLDNHHWNQVSGGIHYLLSKRTDLYFSGDYLRATSGVDAVVGYSFTPSSTPTQADVRIGMRHMF
jgi:outer membrane protein OmpU